MKKIASHGQDAVAMKDAVNVLSSDTSQDLAGIAVDLQGDCHTVATGEDVTFSFLESSTYQGPSLINSTIFLYRGLVLKLLAMHPGEQQLVGIMAGANDMVHEICLAEDLQCVISNSSELKAKWDKAGYEIMGLVSWDDEADCKKYIDLMATLLSLQNDRSFLQLVCHPDGRATSWEFNTKENLGEFVMVSLNNKNKNRKKDVDFKIFYLDQVNKTYDDVAKTLVRTAITNAMSQQLHDKIPRDDSKTLFKKIAIPPDGYCFWHSVLAGLNTDAYLSVQRHTNGFPLNASREQLESKAAKNIRDTVVGDRDSQALFPNGYVALDQIQEIGEQLKLAIRVTVTDEAG